MTEQDTPRLASTLTTQNNVEHKPTTLTPTLDTNDTRDTKDISEVSKKKKSKKFNFYSTLYNFTNRKN